MGLVCPKDDSADCCGKCGTKKIVAVIPVMGRRPLLKHTIERLYKKNGVFKVIAVGHDPDDRLTCIEAGAEWVKYRNRPLGDKWNQGFKAAEKYNPDACLFVGSSDWVSDNWIPELSKYIDDFDLVGLPGCYLLDINTFMGKYRAVFWPGYHDRRRGESIGIGRLITARVLKKLNWMPFNHQLDSSLDHSMCQRVAQIGGKEKLVITDKIQSMAISCNKWPNKHNFEAHWNNRLPSQRIDPKKDLFKWFPESLQIFKTTTI